MAEPVKKKTMSSWDLTRIMCERRIAKLERLCKAVNKEIMTYSQGDNRVTIKVEHKGAMPQIVPEVKFYF